jgi:hypothetical protein
MTLMEDVARLQERLTEASKARARAEGARESAQLALERAHADLRREFNVPDERAAAELLADLNDKLTTLVADIKAKLAEIGV